MNLPTRSFVEIVRDMCAAITTSTGRLVDVSIGSVLRAIIEANAAIVLWVQWLVLLMLQTTRAATSAGEDLDTWMADFSLIRLPAVAASGIATFVRYSGTHGAFVPAGAGVKTHDGSVSFVVTEDISNSAWLAAQASYALPAGVLSIDLPIVAAAAGASGNVLANTVTILASPVPGIDTINNVAPTSGGTDPETDAALRIRFTNFFAARSRGTLDAIGYAISQVGSGLTYVIQENADAAGNFRPGNMVVVVNDGSGTISNTLMNSLASTIASVRPVGTSLSIQPPQIIQVQVSLSVEVPSEMSVATTEALLRSAIRLYVDSVAIGGTLSLTRVSQAVYLAEAQIINVNNVLLNGEGTDLFAPATASFMLQSVCFT